MRLQEFLDAAECLAEALRIVGHHVRTARDGADAVAVAMQSKPHLRLLDFGMPRMDGYEAAGHIREHLRTNVT